ncbi:MAG: hypothetical protein AVDCRST_MAG13-767 [uncultured Solirubrobacteraceae bacterium]|uniref:Uncharacterized protein n=1 Tax=uncultured Solirubrobacteraceae bacterium TaxID=1162706 RepID=A0A6J4RT02_9ACTN|nr:MAG: hypothetical protein AVDCRST_MAG13-767 [uncultured Solirubrobacteraceae bacterium]
MEGHGDLRRAEAQDADDLVARRRADRRGDADAHRPGQPAPDRPRAVEGGVHGRERRAPGVQEAGARGGQAHLPRRALQQRDPELALELSHGLRHGLLAEVQPLGGAGEVQLLRHGDERAQAAQLRHGGRPRPAVVA